MVINKRIKDYKIDSINNVIGALKIYPFGILPYDSEELKKQLYKLAMISKKAHEEGRMIFNPGRMPTGTGKETEEEALATDVLLKFSIKNMDIIGTILMYLKGKKRLEKEIPIQEY